MRRIFASGLLMAGFAIACTPAYIDVATPKDAQFELVCAARCGPGGTDAGTLINVTFGGGARGFSLCCYHQPNFLRQLYTIRDHWCRGEDVPPVVLGDLKVGTVVSEATRKRGATLDHGDGYASFNCGEWLDELIEATETSQCCAPPPPPNAPPPPASPVEPSAPPAESVQPAAESGSPATESGSPAAESGSPATESTAPSAESQEAPPATESALPNGAASGEESAPPAERPRAPAPQ